MNVKNIVKIAGRFLAGSREDFDDLFEYYWERLYAIAYIKLRDGDTAEELVQSLFVEIWERRDQISIRSSFENYIFSALKYKILRQISSERREEELFEGDHPLRNEVEEYLDYAELQDCFEASIKLLPEKCKIIFIKRKLEQKSVKEVSEELNLSQSTVNNQLTKANKIVRDQLSKAYGLSTLVIFYLTK